MKNLLGLFCFLAGAAFLPPTSRATDFVFSSFQCDPTSCQEQTVPVVAGTAFVSYDATCTGGAVPGFSGSAKSQVGVNGPCNSLFIAQAQVQQSTTTQLDDFGCPFNLSTATAIAQILTPLGVPVFTDTFSVSCDGGISGPTNNGERPC